MNILAISTWDPARPDNGCRIRAHYLIRSLARRHKVTVVSFGESGLKPALGQLGVAEYVCVDEDPFRFVHLPTACKWLSPRPTALWRHSAMSAALARHEDRCWGAVIAFEVMATPYLRRFNAPKIIDVDTSLSYQMRERLLSAHHLAPRLRAWVSYRKARAAERRLLGQASACAVVSGGEVPYLAELLGSRVPSLVVSDNGVDTNLNSPVTVGKRPASLIYNGALTYDANYDAMFYFLAEIYPRIQGYCPEVEMTITGSTRGVKLDRLSLQESVHLSGYVVDVRELIATSTVCVVPLRRGAGTRLKILEAMALGTPVVSTTKGAEGLEVVDGQHLLIADDRQEFAECVIRLLREEGLRQRLVRNARGLMLERYDWTIIGDRFVDLVERSAGGGSAQSATPGRDR